MREEGFDGEWTLDQCIPSPFHVQSAAMSAFAAAQTRSREEAALSLLSTLLAGG